MIGTSANGKPTRCRRTKRAVVGLSRPAAGRGRRRGLRARRPSRLRAALPPATTSVLWPPNAGLTAILLLTPRERWWVVLAAVLPAHVLVEVHAGLPMSLVLALYRDQLLRGTARGHAASPLERRPDAHRQPAAGDGLPGRGRRRGPARHELRGRGRRSLAARRGVLAGLRAPLVLERAERPHDRSFDCRDRDPGSPLAPHVLAAQASRGRAAGRRAARRGDDRLPRPAGRRRAAAGRSLHLAHVPDPLPDGRGPPLRPGGARAWACSRPRCWRCAPRLSGGDPSLRSRPRTASSRCRSSSSWSEGRCCS